MSLTQVIMQKDGVIHAISDKRLVQGAYQNGQLVNWEFLNDDQLKIQKIADNIYLTGGFIAEDGLLNHLKSRHFDTTFELIDAANNYDRIITPAFGKDTHNSAIIFGLLEDGKSFLWKGERDGRSHITFADGNKHIIEISAGINGTNDRASRYFAEQVQGKKDADFAQALKNTLKFSASIDRVISPTYDFVTICPVKKESIEEFYTNQPVQLLSSDTGKRIEMTGDENNFKFYDDAEQVVIKIDDDAAIVGYTVNPSPPYNFIPVYGPGIMLGDPAANFLSLATNGLKTSGDVTAIKGKFQYSETGTFQGAGSLPAVGLVLATGNCNLFNGPVDGHIQRIKNITGSSITISGAETVGRDIKANDGSTSFTYSMPAYGFHTFIYVESGDYWLRMY